MVGEIFQQILSSLALFAILVCLITTFFAFVPCSGEDFKNRRSNTVTDSADKENLYNRNHRNFQGIRNLKEGMGVIELSGLSSKGDDDHDQEELKTASLENANTSGDDKELLSGVSKEFKVEETMSVGEVLGEVSERPALSSHIQEEGLVDCISEAKRKNSSPEIVEIDKLNTERTDYHKDEEGFLFDDWEGIERTELERLFGKAVAFANSKRNADLLDSNLKLQLYGLHKVATEGPCLESRPLTLKLSARVKWNAWQRLGAMNMDMAMEQYMILLSKIIPDWGERW